MGGKLRNAGQVSPMRAQGSRQVASFGPFELDLRAGELRSDGHTLILQEQPFLVLKMLLEHPGDVVTREEMRRALWPNDTIVEFNQSINAAIKKLRLALDDSADKPRYVETIARRGYRLIVPVVWPEQILGDERGAEPVRLEKAYRDTGSLIGKKVSHYRVLQVLGGGGMGVVYAAEDLKLGRRVALKFLPEELANDTAAMQRFEREARAASALNHPNICTIYAVEEHDGQTFIAMELLEGQTLRDLISRPEDSNTKVAFQLRPILDAAFQIAKGLEAAHQKGVIHRDIKPANVFITKHGQAKILDFGLAKIHEFETMETQSQATGEAEPQQKWSPLLTLTRTGVAVGTAAYMSPEQVRGEKLDARTDLFSFGLVLYEMAARQRAFSGDTAPVLHHAILNQTPVSVRELNAQIPAKLETIISRALEKDRDARYQTATEMCSDLEALQRQSGAKHVPYAWVGGLGIAAVIALAGILFVLNRAPKALSGLPEIKLRQLTINSSENPVIGGAISPDGKYLAYSDIRGLHLKLIETGETRAVPQPEALKDQSVKWEVDAWFPDSTRVLVNMHPSTEEWNEWSSATASIWAVPVIGGAPAKLRDHAVGCAVSPDGSAISFAAKTGKLGNREIWLMGPSGEQVRKIYEAKESTGTDCWGWSPDGKHYIYVSRDESSLTGFSRPVDGGPPVTLFGDAELSKMNDFVWLHDGHVVYDLPESENSSVCNYWITRLDLATGKQIEEPRRLTNWPSFCVSGGSVTSNDKRLVFRGFSSFYTSQVADLEAGGTRIRNPKRFTLEDTDDQPLGWTLDGKVIIAKHRGDSWRMYKQSLDSDTPEPIAFSAAGDWVLQGTTSPDGKWFIAHDWPAGENAEHPSVPLPILRIPLAGGAPETILQFSRRANVSCTRPPSNTCVIAEQSEDRKQMIIALLDPVTGRGPELARFDFDRELAFLEGPMGVISPDGTRLAMARSPESPIEIRSLDGRLMHKIPSQALGQLGYLRWSPDQKGFYLTRRGQIGNELVYLDFQGNATSLRKCVGTEVCDGVPSPDGRHLTFVDRNQNNNMWMMEKF
jgi:DNA-binding winged helix-turn-helix (wHTH) protein/Tol biopolymer transport system component